MRPLAVEEIQIPSDQPPSLGDRFIRPQIDLLYFNDRHRRSTKTLSRHAPRPSMLIAIPLQLGLVGCPARKSHSTCSWLISAVQIVDDLLPIVDRRRWAATGGAAGSMLKGVVVMPDEAASLIFFGIGWRRGLIFVGVLISTGTRLHLSFLAVPVRSGVAGPAVWMV